MKRSPMPRGKSCPRCRVHVSLCSCGEPSSLTRTPLRKVNPERRKREFRRAYGGADRAAWVKEQPCCVCYATPSENAHLETGGMGRKADADRIANLCARHHRLDSHSLHNLGSVRAFEEYWNIDLNLAADALERRWQQHQESK